MATDVSKKNACPPMELVYKVSNNVTGTKNILMSLLPSPLFAHTIKETDGDRFAGYSQGREFILTDPVICVKM
jgi:hypothetical protein